MNPRIRGTALLAVSLFALGAVAGAATNGNGVVLGGVSSSGSGAAAQAGVAKSGNGVTGVFAIDAVAAGVSRNARGEKLVVGPPVIVEVVAGIVPPDPTGPGDLNGDGIISPADAQEVFMCFLRGGCATPDKTAAADVCPGGPVAVTPKDAQAVFEMFLGLTPSCE